jgi:hypothetical protein
LRQTNRYIRPDPNGHPIQLGGRTVELMGSRTASRSSAACLLSRGTRRCSSPWSITSSEQNTCSPMCVYMPACLAIDLKRATSSINEVSQPIVDSFLVSPTWEPMLLRLQGRQEGQRSQSRRCRQQESPLLRRRRHRRLRRRQLPLHRRC